MKNLYHTRLLFLLLAGLFGVITWSSGQPGSLDNTFGINGVLINNLGDFGDEVNAIAIQGDGKIVLGGFYQSSFTSAGFALLRYNSDGAPDNTFGTDGLVITAIENRSIGNALAIQSDEKIILGGSSQWYLNLIRYNTDGSLDMTFGSDGKVITDIEGYYSERCKAVAVQSNGKILLGGYGQHFSNDNSYLILVQYNEDGTLDSTFGTNGITIGSAGKGNAMAIQSDGKILLVGSYDFSFALERYHADGTVDNTFGIDGKVITSFGSSSSEANAIVIQNDGKIVIGGYAYLGFNNVNFALVRYNSDGSLDSTFGTGGKVTTSFGSSSRGNAIVLQSDGKLVMGGYARNATNSYNFALARYNTDGSLDNAFGDGGKVLSPIGVSYSVGTAVAIQNDGNILLGGYAYNNANTEIALVRYHGDSEVGTGDPCCNENDNLVYPNPFHISTTIRFSTPLQNAELSLYNTYGQVVQNAGNISGKEIQLSRNALPAGIYCLVLSEHGKVISADKLIITP